MPKIHMNQKLKRILIKGINIGLNDKIVTKVYLMSEEDYLVVSASNLHLIDEVILEIL